MRPLLMPDGGVMTAEFVMDQLPVREARALYLELKELFEGTAVLARQAPPEMRALPNDAPAKKR